MMILWSFVYKFSFELTFSFLMGVYATAELLGSLGSFGAFLVAQIVKNLPVLQETQVQSLGREDTLEEEMVTHSSILAWRIPWTEKPGRLVHGGRISSLIVADCFRWT